MNSYTPDLNMRLAVAKTRPDLWPNARIEDSWVVFDHAESGLTLKVELFDISFDAILPLVRGFYKANHNIAPIVDAMDDICPFKHAELSIEWWIFEATPADYCRAYIAAKKGEKDV